MVGNQGHFDGMVLSALRKCREDYPSLNYHVVLAYMPGQKEEYQPYKDGETFYPEGLESVPRRFAIARRNDWIGGKMESAYFVVLQNRSTNVAKI